MAGRDWLCAFLHRHATISFRIPEATSLSRATGFNRIQVEKFYSLLRTVLEENKLQAHRVFNVDESRISTVQKPGKILAAKGSKQVGKMTSAERGQNVTIVCAISASRSYIPPDLIFPRKNMSNALMKGASAGSVGFAVPSGWMDSETFVKWMEHFSSHVHFSDDDKVLLILDNHASHRTLQVVDYARSKGIIILHSSDHSKHSIIRHVIIGW